MCTTLVMNLEGPNFTEFAVINGHGRVQCTYCPRFRLSTVALSAKRMVHSGWEFIQAKKTTFSKDFGGRNGEQSIATMHF